MFENVGSKVKTLAKVVCWIGIIASVIGGIVLIVNGANARYGGSVYVISGILTAVFGAFFSWLGSLSLYAIGETAENSAIAANLAAKADMEREKEKKGE